MYYFFKVWNSCVSYGSAVSMPDLSVTVAYSSSAHLSSSLRGALIFSAEPGPAAAPDRGCTWPTPRLALLSHRVSSSMW